MITLKLRLKLSLDVVGSILTLVIFSTHVFSQSQYWQQSVAYEMNIDFDHTKHQFKGVQKIRYTNNSPDTLDKVFYHLYFNAFQPGSAMDARSRTIADPDQRIGSRISELKPAEIGYHRILSLRQDGKKLTPTIVGTVAEVPLHRAILPGQSVEFEMEFESQVPIQIRRSGRNSPEGVDYTMTQWYPKLAEYDRDGWHTAPYISREFHGVFGTFDVTIEMDAAFVLGGTGVVQNPDEVGHGYGTSTSTSDRITWHFKAENVHDFAWAADTEYRHLQTKLANGTTIHFLHLQDSTQNERWNKLVPYTEQLFNIMNDRFGVYPYAQFSVIQGGDGGMEYPMCTMITSGGSFGGLVSVTVHEAIHNWYYGVLATNETKYPWMDEGFTSFAQDIVLDSLFNRGRLNPHQGSYSSYIQSALDGDEEPLTTQADHYETNHQYGVNAYSKGCVFLSQLEYIVGEKAFSEGMQRYFNTWKFKHPTPTDFKRVMEKVSGLELEWYFDHWIGTTKQVDYGIGQLVSDAKSTRILLERNGTLPMPLEVFVESNSGEKTIFYIPLEVMRGEKATPTSKQLKWKTQTDWPWTYPTYELQIDLPLDAIKVIAIDPYYRTADVNRDDNVYPKEAIIFRPD